MVNPAVVEWFTESVRWLKELWGDFYAEKSGELEMRKNGAGIDTPVKLLLQKKGYNAILTQHIPNLRDMLKERPMAGDFFPAYYEPLFSGDYYR